MILCLPIDQSDREDFLVFALFIKIGYKLALEAAAKSVTPKPSSFYPPDIPLSSSISGGKRVGTSLPLRKTSTAVSALSAIIITPSLWL